MWYNFLTCQGRAEVALNSAARALTIETDCGSSAHTVILPLTLAGSVSTRYGLTTFKGVSMAKSSERFRPNRVCEVCAKPFYTRPYTIARGQGRYCSNQCASIERVGEKSANWLGGNVEKVCEVCGKTYDVPKRKADKSRFCSRKCTNVWRRTTFDGENNPRWAGGQVALTCEICGAEFFVDPGMVNASRCCSYACAGKWKSIHKTGEKSNNWHGGISFDPYPPTFNESFKQTIRERDSYACALCGEWGNEVHHINYVKDDTTPANCITLCKPCHTRTNFNRLHWQKKLEKIMRERGS